MHLDLGEGLLLATRSSHPGELTVLRYDTLRTLGQAELRSSVSCRVHAASESVSLVDLSTAPLACPPLHLCSEALPLLFLPWYAWHSLAG